MPRNNDAEMDLEDTDLIGEDMLGESIVHEPEQAPAWTPVRPSYHAVDAPASFGGYERSFALDPILAPENRAC